MRYRNFRRSDGQTLAAHDGSVWKDLGDTSLVALIKEGRISDRSLVDSAPELDVTGLRLLPPVSVPGKVICVGLNYVDHAKESPYEGIPTYPAFFPRFSSSLIADGDPIIRPFISEELDFEGELAVIIGKPGRHIAEKDALDHVAGYSVFNDASIRNYQFLGVQWTPGKNFDDTGAFGPEFVSADELPAGAKGLKLETRLNGKVVQSANTDDMIFPVDRLIALASTFTTLQVGDVIVAGTPAGVGFARKPPLFMKDGDVVEVEIEKIGTLTNPVRDEIKASKRALAS